MSTLRDTTLRSVVFGMKDVQMTPYKNSQVTLAQPVGGDKFDEYMWVLHTMAQLSRLVYSDSGIVREALLSTEFGEDNNTAVNNFITSLDKKYASQKKSSSTYAGSIEGRPMQSYVIQEGKGRSFARYISSPSDVTFMFLDKSKLKAPFFQEGDVALVFKGSSTIKNFKHDMYSQVKMPKDISDIFPVPKTGMKNLVPPGFVDPLSKNWHLVMQGITDFKPRRLFITGHSLGGAYATMCAFVLGLAKQPGIESIHLVSFGCPTVMGDGARNTFNTILDSGYMTLDRVVSSFGKVLDIIPAIPVGFSHPGFQPLRTEMYPELKTGRAYNLDTIRKVYTGGFLGIGEQKSLYEKATMTHVPTRMTIPTRTLAGRGFSHAEYFDMTFMGGFRLFGMKNPGFKNHTFIADLSDVGVDFKYVDSKPGDVPIEEPDSTAVDDIKSGAPSGGRRRRTQKARGRRRGTRRKM